MKSRITIEFRTKGMHELRAEEDPDSDIITNDVEKQLHEAVLKEIKDYLLDGESISTELEETIFDRNEEIGVEGYDELSDYADEVKLSIVESKIMEE